MATVTTNPGTRIAAFGNPILIASTTSTTEETMLLIISIGETPLTQQYALLVDGSATFQMGGTVQSLLAGFNNPILPDIDNGAHERIDTDKHYMDNLAIYVLEPVDLVSTVLYTGIKIFKSMNLKNDTWDSGEVAGLLKNSRFAMHGSGEITRHGFVGMLFPFSVLSSIPTAATFGIYIGATLIATADNDDFSVTTWRDDLSATKYLFEIDANPYNKLTVHLEKKPERGKILYFLNDLGGWEWHTFIDYDINERTDKEQLTTRTVTGERNILQKIWDTTKEYRLFSRVVTSDKVDYLRFLLTSPVVLDENGLQVRVMDNNLRTNSSELIEPDVTIQYVEEDTINV